MSGKGYSRMKWKVDERREGGRGGGLLCCLLFWSSAVSAIQRAKQSPGQSAAEWSNPSQCSRSCGGGVAFKDRICSVNSSCTEPRRIYVICNAQACSEGFLDFRAEQCANYNKVSIDGNYFEWFPYYDDEDRCALKCLVKDENIHRRLVAKVVDGTPCDRIGLDVCVNGTCRSVGCDGILDSGRLLDACLKCHDSNSSCKTFHGTLSMSHLPSGYSKLFSLPQGITSIMLQKSGGNQSYFVLRDLGGSYYHLNNDSRLHHESFGVRDISVDGTVFLYDRLESGIEYLAAVGPLIHSVSIELLKESEDESDTVVVSYDYSMSFQYQSSYEKFAWLAGSWSACSSYCEAVSSKRNVTCIKVSTKETVDELNCDFKLKPITHRSCGLRPCQSSWIVGQWEQCSRSCGSGGIQQRTVACQKVVESGQMKTVSSGQCPPPKPLTVQPCNRHISCPEWETGSWSWCNRVCGTGTQSRQVLCRAKHPIVGAKTDILPNVFCDQGNRPSDKQSCDAGSCHGVGWIVSEWSGCPDTCESSSETRLVVCSTRDGVVHPDVECDLSKKPSHQRLCLTKDTCIQNPQWFTSSWSQCTAKCGRGIQRRSVFCSMSKGTTMVKLAEAKCHDEPRPETEKECMEQKCDGAWFVGPFGKCSAKCGGGRRSRKVLCLAGNHSVESTECDRNTRPDSLEDCNEEACDEDEFIINGLVSCKETAHGCCPDGVTAAEGPTFFGCASDPIPAQLCVDSEYGCCRDGVTPAQGPFHEGCDMPSCQKTQFGCCDDGKTPAQNSLGEGCPPQLITCEAMAFGCCSDGVSPAGGFRGEGCKISCEETQYGCCPDGVTPQQGLLGEGCLEIVKETSGEVPDCSFSAFGCCSDQVTAAEGPGSAGCPGTNKITTEQPGPAGSCAGTKHGCCSDGVTSASGPGNRGCPEDQQKVVEEKKEQSSKEEEQEQVEEEEECMKSDFGCCPDGVTTAIGPDDWGCPQVTTFTTQPTSTIHTTRTTTTTSTISVTSTSSTTTFRSSVIPTKPAKPKLRHTDGDGCASSVFGCCLDGKTFASGQSFQGCLDADAYAETCQESAYGCCPDGLTPAKGPNFAHCPSLVKNGAVCMMEKSTGPCYNYTVYWYYDAPYGDCARFWYGGCEGNDNRFETREQCRNACVSPKGLLDRCYLPQSRGPCHSSLVRYSYDLSTQHCVELNYSGCLGNDNRFDSLEMCHQACIEPQKPDVCRQPVLRGPCHGSFDRWYFDKLLDSCHPFVYGGCKGNDNRFDSREDCENRCKGSFVNACLLPKDPGPCDAEFYRWFMNSETKQCEEFMYSGCRGNANRFLTKAECESTCKELLKQDVIDKCSLSHERGTCSSQMDRWYFDSSDRYCKLFVYSGCGGNENQFNSELSCKEACNANQQPTDVCKLPVESGQCKGAFRRFSFYGGRCASFTFSGCGGNGNNFPSIEECLQKCSHHITTAGTGRCHLPLDLGPCISSITRWYYSAIDGKCIQFNYGGCGGNKNRFFTEELCKHTCQQASLLTSSTSAPLVFGTSNVVISATEAAKADLKEIEQRETETGNGSTTEDEEYYDELDFTTPVVATKSARPTTATKTTTTTTTTTPTAAMITGAVITICSLPADPGPCRAALIRWHYDIEKGECVRFRYGGCNGNGNNFVSKLDCERDCSVQEVCNLSFNSGSCKGTKKRFYYNVTSGKCQQFVYSGCSGNANRFRTIENCERVCRNVRPSVKHRRVAVTGFIPTIAAATATAANIDTFLPSRTDVCSLGKDTGPCRNFTPVWYFEPVTHSCRRFLYGGCEGNANRFSSAEECWSRCLSTTSSTPASAAATTTTSIFTTVPLSSSKRSNEPQDPPSYVDICEMKADMGEFCLEWLEYWYYDSDLSKCRLFYYGGCYGNENRFKTEAECLFACAGHNKMKTKQVAVDFRTTRKPVTGLKAETMQVTDQKTTAIQDSDIKPGQCPTFDADYMAVAGCMVECMKDGDCDDKFKCCSTGCGAICSRPVAQKSVPNAEERPTVEFHNSSIVSFKSSNVTLPCRARGVPQPQVAWFKSRQPIGDSATTNSHFTILPDGSLLIQDVTAADAGSYSCRAYNSLGAVTQSYTLIINVPAQIEETLEPTDVIAALGSTIEFNCKATGFPFPTIKWRREASLLSIDGTRLRHTFASLQISNIQQSDSGEYVCEASNGFGEPQTRRYRLTVFVPMSVTLTVSQSRVQEEDDVELHCHVDNVPIGNNILAFTWFHNGKPLRPNDRYREKKLGQLLIKNVTLEDAGNFRCTAAEGKQTASSGIVTLSVQASLLPANCTDRSWYANCKLIVEAQLCGHPYFKVFCCKSCHLSGQLP